MQTSQFLIKSNITEEKMKSKGKWERVLRLYLFCMELKGHKAWENTDYLCLIYNLWNHSILKK